MMTSEDLRGGPGPDQDHVVSLGKGPSFAEASSPVSKTKQRNDQKKKLFSKSDGFASLRDSAGLP